jgi:hypothetical protein
VFLGERDPERLLAGAAATGIATTTSVVAGDLVTAAILRNPSLYGVAGQVSSGLGLGSTTLAARIGGTTASFGVFTVGLPYLEYAFGMTDLRTAHRSALAGAIGTGAGAAAGATALALVAAYGTASTGTAIAGLSGAAATGSTLAWFGGGSLASGGLGAAGGSMVMSGGTAIVAIVVVEGVMMTFQYFDEQAEAERIRLTIEDLRTKASFPMERVARSYQFQQGSSPR